MACSLRPILVCLALAIPAVAITVQDHRTAASVNEQSCAAPAAVATFQPTQRQVFLWFLARQVRRGDQLRVEWITPAGEVSTTAQYGELPNAGELCFTTQLPVAGFAPASQPGRWTVRAYAGEKLLFANPFQIAGEVDTGGPVVTSVTWSGVRAQEIDFTVKGRNFQPNPLVNIAQYTPSGGWTYLATLQPRAATSTELAVHYAGLPANEYLVIVENPDQRLSRPMPFVIASNGYKLPIAAGEPWIITQGPYGTFSHWGNSIHAWDIAPRTSNCVVAMKAGIAYTHDLGLQQDHRHRSFGNYITIDHGNGEYSHYAHLKTGTFVVENGQHVEQGQALAIAGNSGYTLGEGGGYHVHVSVTRTLAISAPSVPFEFEDLRNTPRGSVVRTVVSTNSSTLCDCNRRQPRLTALTAQKTPGKQIAGQVAVEQWWSELVSVPKGARQFDVTLSWPAAGSGLDLHLVSPSGHHYGWYGDTVGYSGSGSRPQEFRIPAPEPGTWRVAVQGVRGGPGPIEFAIETTGAPRDNHPAVVSQDSSQPRSTPGN